jgi:hypothetical protein
MAEGHGSTAACLYSARCVGREAKESFEIETREACAQLWMGGSVPWWVEIDCVDESTPAVFHF